MKAIFNRHAPYHLFYDDMGKIVSEISEKLNIDLKGLKSIKIIDEHMPSGSTTGPGQINFPSMITYYRYTNIIDNDRTTLPLPWTRYVPSKDILVCIYRNGLLVNPSEYNINDNIISFNRSIRGTVEIVRTSLTMPNATTTANFNITTQTVIINSKDKIEIPWGSYSLNDLFLQIYHVPVNQGVLNQGGYLLLENENYKISNDNKRIEFSQALSGAIIIIRYYKTGN